MDQNTGLTIALILVAVAVLMQAGAMIGIWLLMRRILGQVGAVRTEVMLRLDPVAKSVTEIVSNAREPLRAITTNLADISKMLRERASDVDGLVVDVLDKSRAQVIRVDQMVSDLVRKVETTSEAVQRGVLTPVQEVSALIKGVRAGFDFLFTHRRATTVSETAQDEQLFI
jgi:phosphoenolpyruvate synthase/pyruvate phosphate dikinase